MSGESSNNIVASSASGNSSALVPLGDGTSIDLSFLPESKRNELLAQHAQDLLRITRGGLEDRVDVATLKDSLKSLADNTNQVAQDGNAVTITQTINHNFGRTEVIMGNTDAATKGKLSRSQTGERDWTPYYVFAGLIALVLIAIAFAGHR